MIGLDENTWTTRTMRNGLWAVLEDGDGDGDD